MKKLWYFFVGVWVLFTSSSVAQNILSGTVTDASTGDPLIGANVIIMGTSLGAATDLYGAYRIVAIPNGEYTVRVSYVGYEPKKFTLRFSGKEQKLDVQLSPEAIEGEVIEVYGQLRGQMAAINQQISAQTIVNVVSEEKIKELPDANAAEAIGRLPGVSLIRSGGEATKVVLRGMSSKFSNITIDGVKIPSTEATTRDVDLSMISQGALSGIELYKALTADQDGDAIAGSVNLVTKKAPDVREVRIEAKGNYNDLMKSLQQYDFSVRYGERFFEDILGLQIMANTERKIRSNERIDIDYNQRQPDAEGVPQDYEISNFKLQFIDEFRYRDGGGVILDINTPDGGSIKFNNIFSETDRKYAIFQRNYPYSTNDVLYSIREIEQNIQTFNSSLQGSNSFLGFDIKWGLSFAQSLSKKPFDYYMDFLETPTATSGMKPGAPALHEHPEELIKYAWNNYSAATCSSAYDRSLRTLEKERTFSLDLSKKYAISTFLSGEVKVGGKHKEMYRMKREREDYSPYYLGLPFQRYYVTPDGTVLPKDFTGTRFERFWNDYLTTGNKLALASDFLDAVVPTRDLFGKYNLAPLFNRTALREWYALNINGYNPQGGTWSFEKYGNPMIEVNDYNVTERITAGYVMNSLNFGQSVTLITGLRVEKENNTYDSKFSPDEATGFPVTARIKDTSSTHVETIYLPNFHVIVRPTEFMNVRFAAYRAIARPDFNTRIAHYAAQRSGSTSTLELGNPNLKTSKAWNYELNTSIFGNKIGLISASLFYKEVKDMFHMLSSAPVMGDSLYRSFGITLARPPQFTSGGYQLTAPYNSKKPTKVWGVEFEHQMNFSFLPGYLQYIVLSYNVSICRSETYVITTSTAYRTDSVWVRNNWQYIQIPYVVTSESKRRSEGQPELFGNISLGYDIGPLSARVSVFYQGEYNLSYTTTGFADNVVDDFTRVDLALKYQFNPYVAFILNVSNLTSTFDQKSIVNRKRSWHLLDSQETYGMTADFGVRVTL